MTQPIQESTISVSATPSAETPASTGSSSTTNKVADKASVIFKSMPIATATFTSAYEPKPNTKNPKLYSYGGGLSIEIDLKDKKFKGYSVRKKTNQIWKRAQKLIGTRDSKASEILVIARPDPNVQTRNLVTITYKDGDGLTKYLNHREILQSEDSGLVDAVIKLQRVIRPGRPNQTPSTLQPLAGGVCATTCLDYVSRHLNDLQAELKDGRKDHVIQNVLATEAMIKGCQRFIGRVITGKEEDLNKAPHFPYKKREVIENDLKALRLIMHKFQTIDRYATYRAVAFWDNPDTGQITGSIREEMLQTAEEISLSVRHDVKKLDTAWKETHYMKAWFGSSWLGKKFAGNARPKEQDFHAYALDSGDVVLPDQETIFSRNHETKNRIKKTSAEQFVASMMANLNSTNRATRLNPNAPPPLLEELSLDTRNQLIYMFEYEKPDAVKSKCPRAYAQDIRKKAGASSLRQQLDTYKDQPEQLVAVLSPEIRELLDPQTA